MSQRTNYRQYSLLAVMVIVSMLVPMQQQAHADPNGCSSNTQDPHYSSGANGVIAKATFVCSVQVRNIAIYPMYLYRCNRDKKSTETKQEYTTSSACTQVADRPYELIDYPTVGKTYTRYVPESSQGGEKGSGWWIARNSWSSCSLAGTAYGHLDWSNIRYIDTNF